MSWKRLVASAGCAAVLVAGGCMSVAWSIGRPPNGGLLFHASGNLFTPRMAMAMYALIPLTLTIAWLAPWGGRWWGGFAAAPYVVTFTWIVWQDGRIARAVVGFLVVVFGVGTQWLLGFYAAWLRNFLFPAYDKEPKAPTFGW